MCGRACIRSIACWPRGCNLRSAIDESHGGHSDDRRPGEAGVPGIDAVCLPVAERVSQKRTSFGSGQCPCTNEGEPAAKIVIGRTVFCPWVGGISLIGEESRPLVRSVVEAL